MPWERTILKKANVSADGHSLQNVQIVEGSMEEHTSISQPLWIGKNIIALSDERGINEPWMFNIDDSFSEPLLPQLPKRDFGAPSWVFGLQHWAVRWHPLFNQHAVFDVM